MAPQQQLRRILLVAALAAAGVLSTALAAAGAHGGSGSDGLLLQHDDAPFAASPDSPTTRRLLQGKKKVAKAPKPPPPPPPPYFSPNYAGPDQPVPLMENLLTNPADCSGFLQPRVYIESQAWFTPDMPEVADAVNTRSMHLHVGACFPHRQWLAGFVAMNVLVQRHNFNPANADVELKAEFSTSSSKDVSIKVQGSIAKTTGWTCRNATDFSVLCLQVYQVLIPTRTNDYAVPDGLNELRLVASAPMFDGLNQRTMQARISSWVVLNNGGNVAYPSRLKKVLPISQIAVMGFPWAYTHAEFLDEIPLAPLTGTWTFSVANFIKTNTANVTGVLVTVDPAFHKSPVVMGRVVKNLPSAADLPPEQCPAMDGHVDCNFTGLTFDTTALDDATWHKLFIRTDSLVGNSDPMLAAFNADKTAKRKVGGGTLSAVTLFMFRTNNTGTAPADPLPAPDGGSGGGGVTSPPDFNPPPGVVLFNGSQAIPSKEATLNIAANDYKCSGWLEPRIFIQGETRYTRPDADVATGGSRVLVGGCLPHAQRVAGKLPLDVLVTRIRTPAGSTDKLVLTATLGWPKGNITFQMTQGTEWLCEGDAAAGTNSCRAVFSAWIDTRPLDRRWLVPDGLLSLQLEAAASIFDGISQRTFFTRAYSALVLANNGDTDTSGQQLEVFEESKAKQGFPWQISVAQLRSTTPPLAPLTASWPFGTRHTVTARTAGVTGVYVAAEPTLHTPGPASGGAAPGPPVVLLSASSATMPLNCPVYNKRRPECAITNFQLDIAQLCNGMHTLVIRTDSFVATSDPTLTAFNDKLAPAARVNGGTFSSAISFAVEVARAPADQQPPGCPAVQSQGTTATGEQQVVAAAAVAPEVLLRTEPPQPIPVIYFPDV